MTDRMAERYEGHFLDALDLPEGTLVPVTIEGMVEPLAERDASGKVIKSAILSFAGKEKRLILNKTNYKNLKAMFGKSPQDWIGKPIHIQRRYLDAAHAFGIDNTMAIRIIPPKGTPILKSAANYMGQALPYGATVKPKPAEEPAAGQTLTDWIDGGVKSLTTQENCAEFQRTTMLECPEEFRLAVQQALVKHEKGLSE